MEIEASAAVSAAEAQHQDSPPPAPSPPPESQLTQLQAPLSVEMLPASEKMSIDQADSTLAPAVADDAPLSTIGCDCLGVDVTDGAPYRQLGSAPSVQDLRRRLESRLSLPSPALRIEMVTQAEREGATEHGCPAAKWILRRLNDQEKVLVLVKERHGHSCAAAVIVVALVSWDGVPRVHADQALDYLAAELPRRGIPSERRCSSNESRICACQGFDEATCGASYSFGCSWSMFHNACKFARTREQARKFRLRTPDAEAQLAGSLNCLADVAGRVLEALAPDAFLAQIRDSELAADCRLGREEPSSRRPFSGVTACLDFCAHPHKDTFALDDGCNVVVTLSRIDSKDEQLHVLPGYAPAVVDEFGSESGQQTRISRGDIQVLRAYPHVTRLRGTPLAPCTTRKKIKKTIAQQNQQQAHQVQNMVQQQHEVAHSANAHQPHRVVAANFKEEHSPASIDSGFESIKSNRSPDKEEQQHQSPPAASSGGVLPPISAWFRKNPNQWSPDQQQQQLRQQSGYYHYQKSQHEQLMSPVPSQSQQQPQQYLTQQQSQLQFSNPNPAGRQDLRLQFYSHQGDCPQPMQYSQCHYMQPGARTASMSYPQHPYPRYPTDHQSTATSYPGGYPAQWRSQPSNMPPYYPQRMPTQYRQYPHPSYTQHQRQTAYDYDYSYHPQYYHQQHQTMQHYPQQYYPYPQHQQQQTPSLQLPMQQHHPQYPSHQQQQRQPQMHSDPVSSEPPVRTSKTQQTAPKRPAISSTEGPSSSAENREFISDNVELFKDERSGGLAIALTHGSVLIEAAKYDSHATTALRRPDRTQATVVSLIYFQHKSLGYAHHGYAEYAEKMRLLRLRRAEPKAEPKSELE